MGVLTGPARGVLRPHVSSTSTAELHERVYVPHSHCEGIAGTSIAIALLGGMLGDPGW